MVFSEYTLYGRIFMCGELNFLTPHAFWNISDFGTKCEKCETINTTLVMRVSFRLSNIAGVIIFVGVITLVL
jgi:hypothetical protein